ncbi:MAG: tetratricopeptide repeat protein [Bacteroidales bacterium]|nr:tetratricopeptide repeat protein [Bacteroidales bacterium]MDD2323697.1 tetratricopeptide repeat protein [Bacteroidales bacterium]
MRNMKTLLSTVLFMLITTLTLAQVFTGSTKKETILFADQQAVLQYNKGIEFYSSQNPDSAIACFTRALEFDPQQYNARFNRSVLYFETEAYDKATNDLNQLITENPSDGVFTLLGKTYQKQNLHTKAMESYRQAATLNPANAENYYLIGSLQLLEGQYTGAIENFSKAIEINPQYALAYNDRGIARRELGDVEGAITDFQKATLLDSKLDFSFNNLGNMRMKMGRYKEAETDFTAALKINPENYLAFNNRGLARLKLEETGYALEDFALALTINPEFYEAKNNQAYGFFLQKEYNKALEMFSKLIESYPNTGKHYYNRAVVREMLRDITGACNDWQKALQLGIEEAAEYLKECK